MPESINIEIITCQDGSHTLYVPELDETYHSKHGAIHESNYVYIQHGLEVISDRQEIAILEVGLGTGLNCFLTALHKVDQKQTVHYHALEPYPLPEQIYSKINYPRDQKQRELYFDIHHGPWDAAHNLRQKFSLLKSKRTLQEMVLDEGAYDLVYYDAFAPSKQSDMWEIEPLEKVYHSMKSGGILVTFCAQGQFKRNLRSIGFQVDTLPGPPGKYEMVRASRGPS